MKRNSDYAYWLLKNFEGSTPKYCVDRIVNTWLINTEQNDFPISLALIAEHLGINPKPIYQYQLSEASLINYENEIRISLRMKTGQPPDPKWHGFNRLRFSYAHELIHCLAYDLKSRPVKRVAPKPKNQEEEFLCNYGARCLLLPPDLTTKCFSKLEGSSLEKILGLSKVAKTSLHLTVLRVMELGLLDQNKNRLYLLSRRNTGFKGKGKLDLRCVAGTYYLNGKENKLNSFKRISNIFSANFSIFSFLNYLDENEWRPTNYENIREIITVEDQKSQKKRFLVSAIHKKIEGSVYIWSELEILDLVNQTQDRNSFLEIQAA